LLKRETGAQERVLISVLVLLETEWVLRSRYGRKRCAAGMKAMLISQTV
jgi:hypothetical protein